MVESSAARRLSLSKIALTLSAILTGIVGIYYVGTWVMTQTKGWVASLPDQQIAFSKIELLPEPEPYVKGGKDLILEQVRQTSKRPANLSRLALDLKEFTDDFKLGSPWIKRVDRVEIPPGRLVVRLEYRKPVAALVLKKPLIKPVVVVVDDEGVALDQSEMKWKSNTNPYQVEGMTEPLILIWGVDPRSDPVFGVPWQALDREGKPDGPDHVVAKAAALADFFRKQPKTTPKGNPAPMISGIWLPGEPSNDFMIGVNSRRADIHWGKPPGDEKVGEPSAQTRWKWLLEWVDRNGPIELEPSSFLYFTNDGVKKR